MTRRTRLNRSDQLGSNFMEYSLQHHDSIGGAHAAATPNAIIAITG